MSAGSSSRRYARSSPRYTPSRRAVKMSYKLYPDVGKVWLPHTAVSFPGRSAHIQPCNIVVATLRRPRWSVEGLFKLPEVEHPFPDARTVLQKLLEPFLSQLDPKKFLS